MVIGCVYIGFIGYNTNTHRAFAHEGKAPGYFLKYRLVFSAKDMPSRIGRSCRHVWDTMLALWLSCSAAHYVKVLLRIGRRRWHGEQGQPGMARGAQSK